MAAAIAEELFALAEHPADKNYLSDYRAHSLVLGRHVVYMRGEERTEALAVDIDDCGGLIVRLDDGSMRTLHTGEISLRLSD